MAGLPIPILGVSGINVVGCIVLLFSPTEGRKGICGWEEPLDVIALAKGEEWEGPVTISVNLSTEDLELSPNVKLENNMLGLISGEMSTFSTQLQDESLTVGALPSAFSEFVSLRTVPSSSFEDWTSETSIGWFVKGTGAVLVSLVEIMALKSFVLGVSMPCSEHVSIFAGFICNICSCVCSDSTDSFVGKQSNL